MASDASRQAYERDKARSRLEAAEQQDAQEAIASARRGWEKPLRALLEGGRLVGLARKDGFASEAEAIPATAWCNLLIPDDLARDSSFVIEALTRGTTRPRWHVEVSPVAALPGLADRLAGLSFQRALADFVLGDPEVASAWAAARDGNPPSQLGTSPANMNALQAQFVHDGVIIGPSDRNGNAETSSDGVSAIPTALPDRLFRVVRELGVGTVAATGVSDQTNDRTPLPQRIWREATVRFDDGSVEALDADGQPVVFRNVMLVRPNEQSALAEAAPTHSAKGGRPAQFRWDPIIDRLIIKANAPDGIDVSSGNALIRVIQQMFREDGQQEPSESYIRSTLKERFPNLWSSAANRAQTP